MKVAYIFATNMASTFKLATMILPQLEAGNHGAEVVGMFFFDDNVYSLRKGDPTGERLAKVAVAKNILLMGCDQCALRRNLAEGDFNQGGRGEEIPKHLIDGAHVGCVPQLYEARGPAEVNQVITL